MPLTEPQIRYLIIQDLQRFIRSVEIQNIPLEDASENLQHITQSFRYLVRTYEKGQ